MKLARTIVINVYNREDMQNEESPDDDELKVAVGMLFP